MEPAGIEVPIMWRGRRVTAFVPTLLADRDVALSPGAVAATARAVASVELSAEQMPHDHAALARLLLRSEGIASSYIEGVTAPVIDVVLAEGDGAPATTAAPWVAANLAAIDETVAHAHSPKPLSVDALCTWHERLMSGSPTPARHVGSLRGDQGWIGGTSPLDAHLVTPPPEAVPELIKDLVAYANRDHADPVAQAAIAHAQFEIIHPFADGNGRVGRVLVAWILVRRLSLVTPPPISSRIAADVGGYGAGLVLFRLGDHDSWVRWFAEAASGAGRTQRDLVASVAALQQDWAHRLESPPDGQRRLRSDSAAWRVIDLLPQHLVLTAPLVATELTVPLNTATTALKTLVEAGILATHGRHHQVTPGRPRNLYVSPELLGLTGSSPLR